MNANSTRDVQLLAGMFGDGPGTVPRAAPARPSGPSNRHLDEAHRQWARRPADERFWTLEEMAESVEAWRREAVETTVAMEDLRVEPEGDDLRLALGDAEPGRFTHWSFGQLCSRIEAPAGYLRELDADLAAECVNRGLRRLPGDARANALLRRNGANVVRSLTSEQYGRIWNVDVVRRLRDAVPEGWRVPPATPADWSDPRVRPATGADVLDTTINLRVGDPIAPAGLYASDHDLFAFLVNEEHRIDDGTDGGLSRGFFVSNSEVGAAAFKVTKFLYRHVCGNHIVWHAEDVEELRIVHRRRAGNRFAATMAAELRRYANESAEGDRQRIAAARRFEIAASKDDVLDVLFGRRIAPRKTLEAAYELVEAREPDLSPRSAWGMAQGLTHLSQGGGWMDRRLELDRAAGRVISLAP